jgi:hypothetical protein
MKRNATAARRQLALSLEREARNPLPEETHQAVVATLADLLLEALGEIPTQSQSEEGVEDDESENHI